jgi:hypothetical protein
MPLSLLLLSIPYGGREGKRSSGLDKKQEQACGEDFMITKIFRANVLCSQRMAGEKAPKRKRGGWNGLVRLILQSQPDAKTKPAVVPDAL